MSYVKISGHIKRLMFKQNVELRPQITTTAGNMALSAQLMALTLMMALT